MSIHVFLAGLLCQCVFASPTLQTEELPPVKKWIKVKDVPAEYAYLNNHPHKCGGRWKMDHQATGAVDEAKYDRLYCKCERCGAEAVFTFNITGWMKSLTH